MKHNELMVWVYWLSQWMYSCFYSVTFTAAAVVCVPCTQCLQNPGHLITSPHLIHLHSYPKLSLPRVHWAGHSPCYTLCDPMWMSQAKQNMLISCSGQLYLSHQPRVHSTHVEHVIHKGVVNFCVHVTNLWSCLVQLLSVGKYLYQYR